ncbi:HAMP domain-containing protein [Nocardioides eburneiflavus]|uniref:histidine kinase n=1 Tax=Nocardioides eburneiflavus TaxID=2518372 RepID=A0A4Z1CF26_9ACTN|nr:ATP-binding protein [Nocardioides eburneiflavus]TGN64725.1 HAMP domain-containing protein [Nocardioides eburneiflavus]
MNRWHPAHWPLRTRVVLAFLAATGVALTVLGLFVQVRVSNALDDRLRDTVTAEADRLEAVQGPRRLEAVQTLGGEVHAQLLTTHANVSASSSLVADPLLGHAEIPAAGTTGAMWREVTVTVFDDDAAAVGEREQERETLVLLVRPTDEGILVVGASREDVDEALAALRNQLLIAGPLALAVAGGLGYLVAGAGLRPMERMRARAATISARSAGERLPVPAADDELRRLALTLNAMLERLDDGLQRERTFVAEASHDLRTPLALMLTEVELALAQQRTPEELTRALHSIHDEVRRLIALAEELLDRASAEDGRLPIQAGPVDLVALATRVANRFQAAAGGRGIHVTAPRPVQIQGDVTRLDRALSNLIDNALRHGSGDIAIEIRATRGGAELTVTDQGAGFAAHDTSPADGDGLGLTIVREIVRAHGGTVDVRRAEEGTRVRVALASPGD